MKRPRPVRRRRSSTSTRSSSSRSLRSPAGRHQRPHHLVTPQRTRTSPSCSAAHGLAPEPRRSGRTSSSTPTRCGASPGWPSVGPGDHVVEIGAGLGSLTLALAETGADVTAVEIDRGLVPVLARGRSSRSGVRVVEADALKARLARRCSASDDWMLVANLPYNVATPLVADLLDGVPAITRMLVMVQREVGERLARARRRRGVRRGLGEGRVLGRRRGRRAGAGRRCSCPKPKVESALVRDRAPRGARGRPTSIPTWLFALVRAGSASAARCCAARSPASRRSSSSTLPASRPTARAEELDVDAWGRLAGEAAPRG